MKLKNAFIFDSENQTFGNGGMVFENGKICGFQSYDDAMDCEGDFIVPGLIDIHTHGREGFDFISASVAELKDLRRRYAMIGITTVVPSLASETLENMLAAVARIREAGFKAVHLEGRYMNANRRGGHPQHLLAPLDPSEVSLFAKQAGNMHLHVSASYELDEDGTFLKAVLENGGTASLAHTDATYEKAMDVVNRGVCSFTHLFNASAPVHHRAGGAVVAGLLSNAYTEVICDGFHLAPETIRLIHKTKSSDRVILITDSMEGAGCPNGEYCVAGQPVYVRGGNAYTKEGTISGSTLNLFQGVKNYAKFCNIPIAEVINLASINPAMMLKLPSVGKLDIGYQADFLRLSPNFEIKEVYVEGVRVK